MHLMACQFVVSSQLEEGTILRGVRVLLMRSIISPTSSSTEENVIHVSVENQCQTLLQAVAIFAGKSAALLMRKIRPEAMREAVQLAVKEACGWLASWKLSEGALPFSMLGQLRGQRSAEVLCSLLGSGDKCLKDFLYGLKIFMA